MTENASITSAESLSALLDRAAPSDQAFVVPGGGHLFILEDPVPPEENDHFRLLRQQTSTPIAMGELFNTQHEYLPLIKDRLIDFIRIHISQIGGLSPARKLAALCEFFGVRTAWHGPGDVSPVGSTSPPRSK